MPLLVAALPTEEGLAALDVAVAESVARGGDLLALVQSGDAAGGERLERALAAARSRLQEAGRSMDRRTVEGDDLAGVMLDTAAAESADMIVVGLRRRTPVGKLLLGSTVQRILLEAGCPVLAVKAAE